MLEHFIERAHVRDLDVAENIRGQIRHRVWLIVRGQEHFLNSRALCAEYFLFYAADRQHDARESHFPSHCQAISYWPVGQQTHQCRHHGCASRRTILRYRARRHVNVNVVLAEKVRIDSVPLAVRAYPRQRRGHRLLHHFAEMPGHGELFSAAHPRRFDEDDVSAHWRPHQPYRNSRTLDAFLDFLLRPEFRHAQILAHDLRRNRHLFEITFRQTPRLFSRDRSNLALQVPHSGFPCETVNDLAQSVIREFQLLHVFNSVFRSLLRNQVFVRNVQLLFTRIPGQLDHFHTVAQRFRYWIHPIGRSDEQHFR